MIKNRFFRGIFSDDVFTKINFTKYPSSFVYPFVFISSSRLFWWIFFLLTMFRFACLFALLAVFDF